MKCTNCVSGSLQDGKYYCNEKGYHITDTNNNIIYTIKEDVIEGDEIGSFVNVKYCDWDLGNFFNLCRYFEEKE